MNPLANVHGPLLLVRPPVPATCNKAGANYKSEITHLTYSPRRAYDEWLSILDAIVACGGDAVYAFEPADEPFLDHDALEVDGDGAIRPSGASEVLGNLADVMTGRVFTANGPWVTLHDGGLRAVMPNMLPHRRKEAPYYAALLGELADSSGHSLQIDENPAAWEGMADVAVVGDQVVLTYAVPGHYDEGIAPKSPRSTYDGVSFAATRSDVPAEAAIYSELVYPHFHGDTVHFSARPPGGPPVLFHYGAGLWRDSSLQMQASLRYSVVAIGRDDAVEQYAGNSRQVRDGVLVPDGVSSSFTGALEQLGLRCHRVPLFELFGKAGGGPACATLYLPATLSVPTDARFRYTASMNAVRSRRERIPSRLEVNPEFFRGKPRG